jgi:hypothetical protein
LSTTRTLLAAILLTSIAVACDRLGHEAQDPLVGAWRGSVQFESGAFAAIKDLEFMYVFNAGGTMTESSNYDGAPPVPPAYGVWRRSAAGKYETKYLFYWTKPPATLDEITQGNGWAPGGYGVFVQEITLAPGGKSFESTMRYQAFDAAGKPVEQESIAAAKATRIEIE